MASRAHNEHFGRPSPTAAADIRDQPAWPTTVASQRGPGSATPRTATRRPPTPRAAATPMAGGPGGLPRWPAALLPEPEVPYGVPINRAPPNADGHIGGGPFGESHSLGPIPARPRDNKPPYGPIISRLGAQSARRTREHARAAALCLVGTEPGMAGVTGFSRYNVPNATAVRAFQRPMSAREGLGPGHAHQPAGEGWATMGSGLPMRPGTARDGSSRPPGGRANPIFETVYHSPRVDAHGGEYGRLVSTIRTFTQQSTQPRDDGGAASDRAWTETKLKPKPHIPEFRPNLVGNLRGRGRVGRCRGLGGNPISWRPEGPDPEAPGYGVSEYGRNFQHEHRRSPRDRGTGIPTEIWTNTEHCIYDYTHKIARNVVSGMRYA